MTHIEPINLMEDTITKKRAFNNLSTDQILVLNGMKFSLLALEMALKEGNPNRAIKELDDYFKILGI